MCICIHKCAYRERDASSHALCACAILRNAKGKQSGRAGGLEYWTEMGASQLGLVVSATFQVPTPKKYSEEQKRISSL